MNFNIIAFETSTIACSVALIANKKIYSRYIVSNNKHSKYILFMINSILIESNINLNNLHALAFGKGPGSFVGVRIAMNVAQGLSIIRYLPIIKISSLKILAIGLFKRTNITNIISIIQATSKKIYLRKYFFLNKILYTLNKIKIIANIEQLKSVFLNLFGTWTISKKFIKNKSIYQYNKQLKLILCNIYLPNAKNALFLAIEKYKNNKFFLPEKVNIKYLDNLF